MSCMDVKRIVMTLKNYQDLFFKKLNTKINKNELEEFFFWLIEHYCDVNRMKYILNPDFNLDKNQELKLLDAINSLKKKYANSIYNRRDRIFKFKIFIKQIRFNSKARNRRVSFLDFK